MSDLNARRAQHAPSFAGAGTPVARGAVRRNDMRARRHISWWAFLAHRISGVALALFLPLHFLALGTALGGDASLQGFLDWTEHPLVKFSEWALVTLLAFHLAGGLRLLAIEFLPWRDWQKSLAAAAFGLSLLAGLAFALNVV